MTTTKTIPTVDQIRNMTACEISKIFIGLDYDRDACNAFEATFSDPGAAARAAIATFGKPAAQARATFASRVRKALCFRNASGKWCIYQGWAKGAKCDGSARAMLEMSRLTPAVAGYRAHVETSDRLAAL
jgi:hypothetical protein